MEFFLLGYFVTCPLAKKQWNDNKPRRENLITTYNTISSYTPASMMPARTGSLAVPSLAVLVSLINPCGA